MRFNPTGLQDAWLIQLDPARDERGFFARTFCINEFQAHGLETNFQQHSTSCSYSKGTLRGMHFQRVPYGEVKLVRCLSGAIWDVIIDLRPESSTFCQWRGFELSAENQDQLYIPKGFAHGFQTLRENAQVNYLISEFYTLDAASGVRHDDPAFGIAWPLPVSAISGKDLRWPDFSPEKQRGGLEPVTLSSS
jgi:dTDP-4-dehydrorhamnose 3,5-epimerase